jgi:hypothetical protein
VENNLFAKHKEHMLVRVARAEDMMGYLSAVLYIMLKL